MCDLSKEENPGWLMIYNVKVSGITPGLMGKIEFSTAPCK